MDINSISPSVVNSQIPSSISKSTAVADAKQQRLELSAASSGSNAQPDSLGQLSEKAEQLNQQMKLLGQSVVFSVDENTQSSVVKVIDKTTDEVIRQFPTEGSLQIMKNIQQYLDSAKESVFAGKEGLTGSLLNEII